MEPTSKKPIIAVFSFFLLLLLSWFIYSAIGVSKALKTKSWPSTNGVVLSCEVKKLSGKGASKSQPIINYSYEVNSEKYTSEKYSSTSARGTSDWAREIISQHPVSSAIKVYYDPNDPKNSVIEPGLQSDDFWMTLLSLFFFVIVLIGLIQQIKKIE